MPTTANRQISVRKRGRHAVLGAACSILLGVAGAAEPFTVADSIEMTQLVDPSGAWAPYKTQAFKLSPDGLRLVIVTKRGNLKTGRNEFTISTFLTEEVHRYVNEPAQSDLPDMDPLATFETASIQDGIDRVVWLPDSRRVVFIGRGADQMGQVYTMDVAKRQLTQLTQHPGNIVRFDLAKDDSVLVFAAHAYEDWTARNTRGYAVQSEYPGSMTSTDPTDAPPHIRYFALDLRTRKAAEIRTEPSKYPQDIAISPRGNFAVVNGYTLSRLPAAWLEYAALRDLLRPVLTPDQRSQLSSLDLDNDAYGGQLDWAGRRILVDVRAATARTLIDAPVVNDGRRALVAWAPDDRRVLLAPTYLPLAGVTDEERARRRAASVIAEVDAITGQARSVTDVPDGFQVQSADWVDGRTVAIGYANQQGMVTHRKIFRRSGERWSEAAAPIVGNSTSSLQWAVTQDMNTPYEIAARDVKTGRQRAITDLNPQLRRLSLGTVESFSWADSSGREFKGGLLLPRGYEVGRRYPIVLQTYGFDARGFLVDGPFGITSAYAARPLANSGLMVLQMNTTVAAYTECRNWEPCGENPTFVSIVESAIDALDAQGLIDRGRVGLIGWSREGMHVFHAITFSRYPIAVATVADSVAYSPFGYAMMYGVAFPGMLDQERMMGGPYWGDDIRLWESRSPGQQLHRIRTPLRFEQYGKGISNYWDSFALLKRQRRPVEMIHVPLETHMLQTPYGRYASQQGNVDWFRFWLKDEEDADPEKAGQYRRWRKLREQYELQLRATAPVGVSAPSPKR